MTDSFTHDFEIKFDSKTIGGEMEFDGDGVASYSFTDDPTLTLPESKTINRIFTDIQELFKLEGGLKKFNIKERVV